MLRRIETPEPPGEARRFELRFRRERAGREQRAERPRQRVGGAAGQRARLRAETSAAERHAELAEDLAGEAGAADRVRTEVEAEAVAEVGDRAAAEEAALLEDGDGVTGAGQVEGRGKTGQPAADDDHVLLHGGGDGSSFPKSGKGAVWQNRRSNLRLPKN
jgi:hypothetical protein